MSHLGLVALVVEEYDEAISWFVDVLDFELREDRDEGHKRWVVVAPPGAQTGILLARAANDRQRRQIGEQAGGRVGWFLVTDDFERDHARFTARGVRFTEEPRHEEYGSVAVFEDLYGNRWDLLEPSS